MCNKKMKTELLYYSDSHLFEFDATVLLCEKEKEYYRVVLDRTAFFPEGGGQKADVGHIGNSTVFDVQIENETVYHYCKNELKNGELYKCKLDGDLRFQRMQNHSGEHIVSGIVHSSFGYNNVGFHMDENSVTIDFDGELTREQLDFVELQANKAVYKNIPFKCLFPSEKELSSLDYRSKLDLKENVRLVKIGDVDLCACCAPHVSSSGEIGIIKLLDFSRHRGGVRITMKAGEWALCDYANKYENVREISNLFSAKQDNAFSAVQKYCDDSEKLHRDFTEFKNSVVENDLKSLEIKNGVSLKLTSCYDSDMLRKFVNSAYEKGALISAAFSGDDENGYSYIILSHTADMKQFSQKMNSALCGRGGGRDGMIQGKVSATSKQITEFFSNTGE